MTQVRTRGLVLTLILAGLVLAGLLAYGSAENSINAAEVSQIAEEEKQSIVDQIAVGKILHVRTEKYIRYEQSTPPGPWIYLEPTVEEIWMAADENG